MGVMNDTAAKAEDAKSGDFANDGWLRNTFGAFPKSWFRTSITATYYVSTTYIKDH